MAFEAYVPLIFIFTVIDVTLSPSSSVTDQRIKRNGDTDLECGGWLGTAFSLPSVPGYRQGQSSLVSINC